MGVSKTDSSMLNGLEFTLRVLVSGFRVYVAGDLEFSVVVFISGTLTL